MQCQIKFQHMYIALKFEIIFSEPDHKWIAGLVTTFSIQYSLMVLYFLVTAFIFCQITFLVLNHTNKHNRNYLLFWKQFQT